jgi:hypothetical protein
MNNNIAINQIQEDDGYNHHLPQKLLDYCYSNGDKESFFGEHKITERKSDIWEKKYPEWRDALELAPKRTQAGTVKSLKIMKGLAMGFSLLDSKGGIDDLVFDLDPKNREPINTKDLLNIILKMEAFKMEKEKQRGTLKDEGIINRTKVRNQKNTNEDEAQMFEDYIMKNDIKVNEL